MIIYKQLAEEFRLKCYTTFALMDMSQINIKASSDVDI